LFSVVRARSRWSACQARGGKRHLIRDGVPLCLASSALFTVSPCRRLSCGFSSVWGCWQNVFGGHELTSLGATRWPETNFAPSVHNLRESKLESRMDGNWFSFWNEPFQKRPVIEIQGSDFCSDAQFGSICTYVCVSTLDHDQNNNEFERNFFCLYAYFGHLYICGVLSSLLDHDQKNKMSITWWKKKLRGRIEIEK